jgi:chloramphenicol O-acetyltransferase type A
MKYIDLESWPRKDHFAFFYRMDYPQFNICLTIDITNFLNYTREKGLSFYFSMIHAVTKAMNETEVLNYRIREGKVVLHEMVHPSFTYLQKGSTDGLFKMITVDMIDNSTEFEKITKEICFNQKDNFGIEKLASRDDLIYITCLPWISFTHLSHTITINRNDSVPKISWGKYFTEGEKVLLPFSIQVHHALADGYQVSIYLDTLQKYLDSLR